MVRQQEATTDRLVSLIASIKMERKSGQLRVKRGEGLTSEEGVLTFIQGQVTQASVGRRSGADALNWLSTWGRARYVFVSPDSAGGEAETLSDLLSSGASQTAITPHVRTDRLETEPLAATSREVPRVCMEFSAATARIGHLGLSRSHRRLYLLIDGHRSIDDLEPLIGRKGEEVRSMLHDLEWSGIIQIVTLVDESAKQRSGDM